MKINEIADANPLLTLAKNIAAECQPYLNQISSGTRLWRGLSGRGRVPTKLSCPVNRQPQSTTGYVHEMIDDWFVTKTGIAYRSNAVFATGNADMAREFGELYAIFPIGDFKFCWSTKVIDMTYDLVKPRSHVFSDLSDMPEEDDNDSIDEVQEAVIGALENAQYKQDNLPAAIYSGNEIMIHCKQYYAVPHINIVNVMGHLIDLGKGQ
jgi:hypothetical protein